MKGTEDSPDLWKWRHWEPWAIALAPFMMSPRGKATVRCLQHSADPRKMIPFGKLYWDEKSHQRWSHSSPMSSDECAHWEFLSLEAWTPSWTICERERIPPEFFFSLRNPNYHRRACKRSGPFLVCAIASSLEHSKVTELESVLGSLAKTLSISVFAHKKRPWGISSYGKDSFTYSIQDMTDSVLSGATDLDQMRKPFDEDLLPETWKQIEVICA